MARCEEIQADRMESDTRLRMELQSTQIAAHRLQQEKVEVSARLALADNEASTVMRELVVEQEANKELRTNLDALRAKLATEEAESASLRKNLSQAADDVLNLQHELNTVLKVQSTLRKENRDLGELHVQAVDYRTYMPPYVLSNSDATEGSWAARNNDLTLKYNDLKSTQPVRCRVAGSDEA